MFTTIKINIDFHVKAVVAEFEEKNPSVRYEFGPDNRNYTTYLCRVAYAIHHYENCSFHINREHLPTFEQFSKYSVFKTTGI